MMFILNSSLIQLNLYMSNSVPESRLQKALSTTTLVFPCQALLKVSSDSIFGEAKGVK